MLTELRLKAAAKAVEAGGGTAVKRKLAELTAEKRNNNNNKATLDDGFVNEGDILGPRKKGKMDYEERMASIQKGREGRDKFGSKKGKKDKAAPSSSTNREKARNKPIMMAIHSNKVMQKKKASLRDVQVSLWNERSVPKSCLILISSLCGLDEIAGSSGEAEEEQALVGRVVYVDVCGSWSFVMYLCMLYGCALSSCYTITMVAALSMPYGCV
jgi:hypothetical protein